MKNFWLFKWILCKGKFIGEPDAARALAWGRLICPYRCWGAEAKSAKEGAFQRAYRLPFALKFSVYMAASKRPILIRDKFNRIFVF